MYARYRWASISGGLSLVRPPGDELLEANVAVTFSVGDLEIELTLRAGNVGVELVQQHAEFGRIEEAIAVEVAGIEGFARLRNIDLCRRFHDRSRISEFE